MDAESVAYESGATYTVPERGSLKIIDCPETVERRLKHAGFDRDGPTTYTKEQESITSDDTFTVATVTVRERELHISVRDSVGILTLTPDTKLRIEPKIDWDPVFDMLLDVYDRGRTAEYRSLPLEDESGGERDLADIFPLLAINYADGLEEIHRNGFVRNLVTRRADLESPRGTIDIERSLVNQVQGRTEQHCLFKEVDYDNAVNSLLLYAGRMLLRLFREYADEYESPGYNRVFSDVYEEVKHLESLGVTSDRRRYPAYQRATIESLPKQRSYYRQALEVAQSILDSSLGTFGGSGRELLVDYVLNMESLFEEYSQVALEEQLATIKSYDYLDQTESVSAIRSPKVEPFTDNASVYHQPDHALEEGDTNLAVLDSKYYAEGKDPTTDSPSRSRLFSYAYLLDADRLAFLCPLLEPKRQTVSQTGADLQVISPSEGFSLDAYKADLHDYLYEVLVEGYPTLRVFRRLGDGDLRLCLASVDESDLERADDPDGPFGIANPDKFSLQVVKGAASHSAHAGTRADIETWTRRSVRSKCLDRPSGETCIPTFETDDIGEWIVLYFLGEEGVTEEKVRVHTQ